MTPARAQIIATTCQLLEYQGYHATGLNQIIKESGSPKGSLYYYFPGGKEELVAEAINYVGQIILDIIRTNLTGTEDPAASLREYIINVSRHVEASGFRTGGPITIVALEMAASSERLRETCKNVYDAWQGAFYDWLISSGFSEERARSLAGLILVSIEGGINLCRTRRSTLPLETVARELSLLIACTRD